MLCEFTEDRILFHVWYDGSLECIFTDPAIADDYIRKALSVFIKKDLSELATEMEFYKVVVTKNGKYLELTCDEFFQRLYVTSIQWKTRVPQ